MADREYEYTGLMAQAWDAIHGNPLNAPDRRFFLEKIRRYGQPVLDVGCGTGRLLLDFVQQGIDCDGVDNSPEMLALCRRKADRLGITPKLYQQSLGELALPRRYRTILVPTSTLQYPIEPWQADQAARQLHDLLLPGGAIVAELMTFWTEGNPLFSEWEHSGTREDGVSFKRIGRTWYRPETGCIDTEDHFQKIRDGQIELEESHRRTKSVRSYTPSQARTLLERAEFINIELHDMLTNGPASDDSVEFMIVGEVG